MLFSTMTPLIVLLLAGFASYAVTRPIGYARRYIGALVVSVLLGAAAGALEALLHGPVPETTFAIPLVAGVAGWCLGSVTASRRRLQAMTSSAPEPQRRTKRADTKWHDHAVRRA